MRAIPHGTRYYIIAIVVSQLFLSQIALNINEFAATPSLFLYLFGFAWMVVNRRAELSSVLLAIFVLFTLVAVLGFVAAPGEASINSMLLALLLHIPYIVKYRTKPQYQVLLHYFLKVFVTCSTVLAAIAIVQFALVNFAGLRTLSNVANFLPAEIHNAGIYAYTRVDAGVIKANGFFLRESSSLSFTMAFAILIEYIVFSRVRVLIVLLVGLFLSFSGTGLLVLAAGMLLPFSRRSLIALIPFAVGALLVWASAGQIPGLDLWINRLSEFETVNTSGYSRFVAPREMVSLGFRTSDSSFYIGNGAGSYRRAVRQRQLQYEIADPAWAKLLYEYGVLGFFLLTSLIIIRLYTSRIPIELCSGIFVAWMFNGAHFLVPDFVLLLWAISLMPRAGKSHTLTRKRMQHPDPNTSSNKTEIVETLDPLP